ncbi:MAG: glutamine-hydrolyzing GMP synthase [Clostridia bacterium]|nr:glutamine-hydrolyzing GMP synthase [Clostridia bacterium]
MKSKILIVDFGSQYTQVIARRVREANVYCEIIPYSASAEAVRGMAPSGIILSGGPASVYQQGAPSLDPKILDMGVPILGICYGMQHVARALGGEVRKADRQEFGRTELEHTDDSLLFDGVPPASRVWMSHGDSVEELPAGFRVVAWSANTPVAAIEHRERRIWGVQFHPEVAHTEHGKRILENFLMKACSCSRDWTAGSVIEESVAHIAKQVGDERAVCALSGGVDSSVAALLVQKAIGARLTCVFVDHGLLRKEEAQVVEDVFKRHFHMNLIVVDAQERFLGRLSGVVDPEAKRKIIGEEFIRVFEDEAAKLGNVHFLVQGTLYSDVVESASATGRPGAAIKSHHNVGGLPEDIKFELVEPLRDLFKDEVRQIGRELGLPAQIVERQPFPGPGLAVRIIGDVNRERLGILREADAIVRDEIESSGANRGLWQYFAILPAMRSVGVMGDFRTYAYPAVVRAVISEDAMTADWARLPYEVLDRISTRIVNEVPGVNRVVYDITTKPPATIEWE